MRQPTRASVAFRWWSEAVAAGGRAAREINDPQCGWYRRRLVKGGPYVPARIWIVREVCPETGELLCDETLACEVNGLRRDPVAQWTFLQPISRQEYDALCAAQLSSDALREGTFPIDLNTMEAPRP
jgi:hypothetical protein